MKNGYIAVFPGKMKKKISWLFSSISPFSKPDYPRRAFYIVQTPFFFNSGHVYGRPFMTWYSQFLRWYWLLIMKSKKRLALLNKLNDKSLIWYVSFEEKEGQKLRNLLPLLSPCPRKKYLRYLFLFLELSFLILKISSM